MRIKKRVLQKFVSVLSSALLLLNSFSPYLLVLPVLNPSPVGAQIEVSPTQEPTSTPSVDATPTEVVATDPTPSPTVEVSPTEVLIPEPTATPITDTTITPTTEVTPDVDVTPVETIAPTEVPTLAPVEATSVPSPPQDTTPAPGLSSEPSPTPSPSPTIEPVMTPDINGIVETTLVESYECRADSLNGCLVTDKADYAPTDIAIISGHAFSPNTQYTLRISSSDSPAVDSSYTITTDDAGSFTYSYQLDGNYRPNYLVELKDSFGFVVASVTFTDTDPKPDFISTKSNNVSGTVILGNNFTWSIHILNQGIATATFANNEVIFKDNLPDDGVIYGSLTYTQSGITGTINCNINSSNDLICKANGTVTIPQKKYFDLSFQVTPTGSVSKLENPRNGSGNKCKVDPNDEVDESNDNNNSCSDDVNVVLTWPTNWNTPNSCVTDPTNEPGVSPNEVDLTGDISNPAVGFYLDSNYQYFRERIDGNPGASDDLNEYSWVVLFQTESPKYQYLASVTGKNTTELGGKNKVSLWLNDPATAPVDFIPLFGDTADSVLWSGASGVYSRIVSAGGGKYYIDWAIPLAELTSRGITSSTTKFYATSTNANNYNKDHLKCYEAFSDLEVLKSDSPDPVTNGGTLTYTLAIHNYGPDTAFGTVVTDTLPSGYAVVSVTPSQGTCSDTSAPSLSCELGDMTNGANASVTIVGILTGIGTVTNNTSVTLDTTKSTDLNLSNNDDSEDTTINPSTGTVIVHKDVQGPNGEDVSDASNSFQVSLDGATGQVITDDLTVTYNDVTVGDHTITESLVDSDYTLYGISTVAGTSGNLTGLTINVTTGTNDVYVTNRQKIGKIIVVKDVVNPDGGEVSDTHSFTVNLSPGSQSSSLAEGSNAEFIVNPGTYTASESSDANYTSLGCLTPTRKTDIVVGSGEEKTVTCVNQQKKATITVIKDVTKSDGSAVDDDHLFHVTLNSELKDLTEGTNAVFSVNPGGPYGAVESSDSNYTLVSQDGAVTVGSNGSATINIVNKQNPGTISGYKYKADGTTGISGWAIDLYNCLFDFSGCVLGASTTTNGTGYFSFTNLVSGFYQVREFIDSLFTPVGDTSHDVAINPGTVSTNNNFANFKNISLKVCKVEDADGSLTTSDDQSTLSGWTMTLTSGGEKVGTTQTTADETGCTTFSNLGPGRNYSVTETLETGWTNLTPLTHDFAATADGVDQEYTFVNTHLGKITVEKQTLPDGDTQSFDFTASYDADGFSLTDGQTNDSGYLLPGTYSVSEDAVEGWDNTTAICSHGNPSAIIVSPGESVTCNFTNTKKPKLTVTKIVTNNNGGTKVISDFPLYVDSTLVTSGVTSYIDAGTYSVSETGYTGYDAQFGGDCSILTGSVTLAAGDDKECTITNDDKPGTLIVKKVLNQDDGGGKAAIGFSFKVNDGASTPFEADAQNDITVNAGTYSVVEDSTTNAGYDVTYDNCDDVFVPNGGTQTCTITNDDQAGSITIIKNAAPNAGRDFNFTSSNPAIPSFTLDDDGNATYPNTRTFTDLSSGSYVITEGADSRWNLTNIVCVDPDNGTTRNVTNRTASIDLDLGEDITCTFTNRRRPQLTVIKHVVNDNGGTLSADDFTINITGQSPSDSSFPGDEAGTLVILNPGTYGVDEVEVAGYSKSLSANCSGTLAYGNQKTCTVTNDDIQPTLTVTKIVRGGTAEVSDFTLHVTDSKENDTTVVSGVTTGFNAETYKVSEINNSSEDYTGVIECEGIETNLLTLNIGDNKSCTITNTRDTGTLQVLKNVDLNGDGDYEDEDETRSTDWKWQYNDGSDQNTGDEPITLNTGDYDLAETVKDGFTQLDLTCEGGDLDGNTVTIAKDADVVCTFENKRDTGKIIVNKIIDIDGDTGTEVDQTPGENWQFDVDGTSDGDITDAAADVTDSLGNVTFELLKTGTYTVIETKQTGYDLIDAYCQDENGNYDGADSIDGIEVDSESVVECTFINSPNGRIHGQKWNDVNGNGEKDEEEEYLSGWKIFLDKNDNQTWDDGEKFMLTDSGSEFGWYWFDHLLPGTYDICEELQGGWLQTYPNPSCHSIDVNVLGETNTCTSSQQLNSNDGGGYKCDFGNKRIDPELQISKSNDSTGDESPGGTVIYTLKIKALKNKVLGVKIKDLLPKGFSFQNIISAILNGSTTLSLADPAYHSPGTYELGDMNTDDEIIIKYQAKIGDSQKFGIYKDVAWAEGTSEAENKVLALAQPEGKVSENFVGTSVKVDGTISEQGSVTVANEEEGQVLGASTSLPATGANRIWIFIALLLSIIGAISVAVGLIFKKGKFKIMKNLFINTLFTVSLLFVVHSVSAASNMTIRLSEPKTPTKVNNFTIDFVTLDLTDSGSDITVKCFYKKNLADAWTQYGPDITVAAPGNNGSCQEASSFVTSTQTTYYFKATATNEVDSDDTELQGLVSVGYDDRDPSAPTNYVKEKISSCQYKVSFKTADDGMTTRVEVYRSENTTMSLDGSTKAGEVAVGTNTSSSFTDTIPDCSKSYYYVIRAFNVQGNSSAAIGDSVTITSSTTTTTTTTTGEAIPVTNVTLPAGTGGGSVLGEETKKEEKKEESQKKEEVINVSAKKGLGAVLGAVTKKENRNFLIIASILGLVIIAYGVYIYKKKQNPQI